jgi:hypothetical protein
MKRGIDTRRLITEADARHLTGPKWTATQAWLRQWQFMAASNRIKTKYKCVINFFLYCARYIVDSTPLVDSNSLRNFSIGLDDNAGH